MAGLEVLRRQTAAEFPPALTGAPEAAPPPPAAGPPVAVRPGPATRTTLTGGRAT